MTTYVYPSDETGCGHYRLRWPAEAMRMDGHDVKVIGPGEQSQIGGIVRNGRMSEITFPDDADTIVLQRPLSRHLPDVITAMRHYGLTVIVDIDDDLRYVHPANVAFFAHHPKANADKNWHHTEEACRRASLVTVSTDALAQRYGQHGRVAVLRNCIPARFLAEPRRDSDTIGWPGSTHSHPDDLQSTGGAFARVGDVDFLVVGPGAGVQRNLGLRREPRELGVVPFADWGSAVAQLGIGIAPLAQTAFNAAKSWLKPLEMAACGVPWIASDRPEYRRLQALGCGMVVDKARDWERALRLLLTSADRRDEMSLAGRAVAHSWTIEGNAWRWAEAWERARSYDREAVSA